MTSNPERQAAARREIPGARILTHAGELWAEPDAFDLAVIATGTQSHVPLALEAVAAARHAVVEKPLAPTAAAARELARVAAERGVLLVPFHNRRWDSDHLTLQRLLADGALGEMLRYESRFDRWRPDAMPGSWREDLPSIEGGGVLLDLGVHLVDQALVLHGAVDRVYAEVFSRRGGADDDVFIALQHRSGVTSHLWANTLAAAAGPRLRVLGRRAAYVVDAVDGQEAALRGGARPDDPAFGVEPEARWGRLVRGSASEPVASEPGSWQRFYAGLVATLREGAAPPVPLADAIAALDVLDAARESSRTGGDTVSAE